MFRRFHATNQPDTCLWCGHTLVKYRFRDGRGYDGEGVFCSLKCGYSFAKQAVASGFRFQPKETPPEKARRRPHDKTPKCEECGSRLKLHYGTYDDIYLFCNKDGCSWRHNWRPAVKRDDSHWELKESK